MKKLLLFLVVLSLTVKAGIFTHDGSVKAKRNVNFMGIRILDQQRLSFGKIDGVPFGGISDLSYDAQHHTLSMISDRGSLFTFVATLGQSIHLRPLRAAYLRNPDGNPCHGKADSSCDSEGMTHDAQGRVLLSFEGYPPRVAQVGVQPDAHYGQLAATHYPLPHDLNNTRLYVNSNRELEAVVYHPKYGLLTAAENPIKTPRDGMQRIYSLDGKHIWAFRPEREPNTGIVSMAVMDDGNLLVLERAFIRPSYPFVVTLKKVYLQHAKGHACRTKILAKMDIHSGWWVDNYEGLTKVGKNRYVMVSDDDFSWYRPTLMMLFEVLDH